MPHLPAAPTDLIQQARPAPKMSADDELLAARVERAIRRGTNDKVRNLSVTAVDGTVVLHGRCATYYCKQLAQTAAFPVLEDRQLSNQIEVW